MPANKIIPILLPKSPDSNEKGSLASNDANATQLANEHTSSLKQDASSEEEEAKKAKEKRRRRHKISAKTWKQVSTFMRVTVINICFIVFISIVVICAAKFQSSPMIEVKTAFAQNLAWFRLAICLRPFITPQLLVQYYTEILDLDFKSHLLSLNSTWDMDHTLLDNSLEKENFLRYFREIHPWNRKNSEIRGLWDYQLENVRKTFRTFSVNYKKIDQNYKVSPTSRDSSTDLGKNISYTVLYPSTVEGAPNQESLSGVYTLSPEYAGCLNMTINEPMGRQQMELFFRMRRRRPGPDMYSNDLRLYEVADLFFFNKNEEFTEISVVKRHARYSFVSKSLTRLYITGGLHLASSSSFKPCHLVSSGTTTNCRYWCLMRRLMGQISCTLPWMHTVINRPWMDPKFKKLSDCNNYRDLKRTLDIQNRLLKGDQIDPSVSECWENNCERSCETSEINIKPLGGVSIGRYLGLSLTVDADMQAVSQERNYPFAAMAGELCASVSFLLGLSGISIYDWCVAFVLWLHGRRKVLGTKGSAVDEEGEQKRLADYVQQHGAHKRVSVMESHLRSRRPSTQSEAPSASRHHSQAFRRGSVGPPSTHSRHHDGHIGHSRSHGQSERGRPVSRHQMDQAATPHGHRGLLIPRAVRATPSSSSRRGSVRLAVSATDATGHKNKV